MASSVCSIRVQIPRALFRKLMARSILERTDLSAIVVRAVRTGMPPAARGEGGSRGGLRRPLSSRP
ncbi:MAG TPA: hypothetical protein VGG37_04515 [Opitutaceae bacterium]